MANGRPPNHVELALQEALGRHLKSPDDEPSWTHEQIAWMQKTFPPRCYRGDGSESLETHLRYAGVVDFIANRVTHYENQKAQGDDGPEDAEHV